MPADPAPAAAAKRPHVLRRLYNWVLHWAETPYGAWALFLLAFAESSFFPIPPDVLLIALAIAVPLRSFRYAAIAALGSVLGGVAGYGIGWGFWSALGAPSDAFSLEQGITGGAFLFRYIPGFTPEVFAKVRAAYEAHAGLTVFTAAFTPIPYKVITIAAGVCKINFVMFLVGSTVGRTMRFFLVATLIRIFGRSIREFIDKYFNILTVLFTILLIGGFAVIRYWEAVAAWVKSLF